MKFINRVAFILAFIFQVVSMSATTPSVGVFPATFPRDPVAVNIYLEHILMGQIIEPLVESGQDGTIVPAAASRWKFSSDGLTLTFFFDGNTYFSNGNALTAGDVKYTLERHLSSENSQSKSYLSRIAKMEVVSPKELRLRFNSPYVATLKALSRDQLGIVPEGWKFDPNSEEPFIGTGAYRCIRENNAWVLVKNKHFRHAEEVKVPKWNVVIQPKTGPTTDIPSLVPFAYSDAVDAFKAGAEWQEGNHVEESVTHFFQSSAWWYPHGTSFNDEGRQKLGMCATEDLIAARVSALNLHRTTGLIPEGIAGHLAKAPKVSCDPKALSMVKNRAFTMAVLAREFPVMNDPASIKAIESKYKIKLNLVPIEPQRAVDLKNQKPDIFVLAFAGGFQDPEGFLTVITAMLNTDLVTVFKTDQATYQEASSESDWEKRTPLYIKINTHLIKNMRMVPGWKVKAQRVRCKEVVLNGGDLRYTPKLRDYELREEDK